MGLMDLDTCLLSPPKLCIYVLEPFKSNCFAWLLQIRKLLGPREKKKKNLLFCTVGQLPSKSDSGVDVSLCSQPTVTFTAPYIFNIFIIFFFFLTQLYKPSLGLASHPHPFYESSNALLASRRTAWSAYSVARALSMSFSLLT